MSELPQGMIKRVDQMRHNAGKFLATIGYPTAKGNFSIKLGKWAGIGMTEDEAVQNAIEQFYQGD